MPENLLVKLRFNDAAINVTASRINVSDFQAKGLTECRANPEDMRNNLERNGLAMSVVYNGNNVGKAKVTFLPSFIDRIDDGMSDAVHAEECPIIHPRQDEQVGTLEVLCYLTIKCEEDEQEQNNEQEHEMIKCSKKCINLGKHINQLDMMFVVSAPHPSPIPCPLPLEELQPEEGDERLKLDLERYCSVNQRVYEPPEMMCGRNACLALKVLTKQCEDFIDAVVDRVNELPSPISIKDTLYMRDQQEPHMPSANEPTISIPVGDMELRGIKPIRFCPICLISMSWLPKYATCPRCCTKTVPQFDNEADKNLTADQILQEYIKENPYDENESSNGDGCKKTAFCCCALNKMCAHCRVLNACADIFKPKCELKMQIVQSENDDYRIIVKPVEKTTPKCLTYLERVFFELQLLYKNTDAKKIDESSNCCTRPLLDGNSSPKVQSITSL